MSLRTLPGLMPLANVALLVGCAPLPPQPLADEDRQQRLAADRVAIQQGVEPVGVRLDLDEAIARALKDNLERRARQLEQALALQQYEAGHDDLLPRLVAAAGWRPRHWRGHVAVDLPARSPWHRGLQSLGEVLARGRGF